jgi:hypothetical protein
MKELWRDIQRYLIEHAHAGLFLSLGLTLAAAVWLNYALGFKRAVLDSQAGEWRSVLLYLPFYAVPYYGTALLTTRVRRETRYLRAPSFWILSGLALLVLTLNRPLLSVPFAVVDRMDLPVETAPFVFRILMNVIKGLGLILPVWLLWRVFDASRRDFYGLTWSGFRAEPFMLSLILVVPLVTAASFLPDFQHVYPVYRPGAIEAYLALPVWLTLGGHELTYAFRFVGVEVMFRGLLTLGMMRWLGGSVLPPMVVLYAFWHFGKPWPEAASSVIGGYVLGVIALRRSNIIGCIILHAGLAVLMNLAALGQLYAP